MTVSQMLTEEQVGLEESNDALTAIYFGSPLLGQFGEHDLRLCSI